MKKTTISLAFLGLAIAATAAIPVDLTLNLTTPPNQLTITESAGVYSITTTGIDGYVAANTSTVVAADNYIFSFDYTSTTGLDEFGIFFNLLPSGAVATKNITLASLAPAATWTNVKINMKNIDGLWSGTQDYFRLDFGKSAGKDIQVKNIKFCDDAGLNFPTSFDITLNATTAYLCSFTNPAADDWIFTTTGADPYIHSNRFTTEMYNPSVVKYLSYEYKSTTGISDMEVYFYNPSSTNKPLGANANYRIQTAAIPAATNWTVYSIDMSTHPKWKDAGSIRLDFGNATGKDFEIRNIKLANYIPSITTEMESAKNTSKLIVTSSIDSKEISIHSTDKNIDKVSMFSSMGAKLFESQYQSNNITFNVSKIPNGVYLLQVLTGLKVESHKILIGK